MGKKSFQMIVASGFFLLILAATIAPQVHAEECNATSKECKIKSGESPIYMTPLRQSFYYSCDKNSPQENLFISRQNAKIAFRCGTASIKQMTNLDVTWSNSGSWRLLGKNIEDYAKSLPGGSTTENPGVSWPIHQDIDTPKGKTSAAISETQPPSPNANQNPSFRAEGGIDQDIDHASARSQRGPTPAHDEFAAAVPEKNKTNENLSNTANPPIPKTDFDSAWEQARAKNNIGEMKRLTALRNSHLDDQTFQNKSDEILHHPSLNGEQKKQELAQLKRNHEEYKANGGEKTPPAAPSGVSGSSSGATAKSVTPNDSCRNSVLVKGEYVCDPSNAAITASGIVSQAGDMAGSTAVNIGGAAAIGSASSGKVADVYNKAGDAALVGAWSNWAVGAANMVMGGVLSGYATKHGSNKREIEKALTDAEAELSAGRARQQKDKTLDLSDLEENVRIRAQAVNEQRSQEEKLNLTSLGSYAKGVERSVEGAKQYMLAQQNYAAGCIKGQGQTCDETPLGLNYNGGNGTDQNIVPNTETSNNTDNASTDISGIDHVDQLGPPTPYVGPMGITQLPNVPGSAGGAPGGGSGGGSGLSGGSTSAAKEDEGSPKAQLASQGKSPFYTGNGTGAESGTKGAGASKNGAGMPDLAGMLAAAFGKKPEDKDAAKNILDFAGRASAGTDSLLSPEVNIFARIHDAYQEKQKINVVGLLQFPTGESRARIPASIEGPRAAGSPGAQSKNLPLLRRSQ